MDLDPKYVTISAAVKSGCTFTVVHSGRSWKAELTIMEGATPVYSYVTLQRSIVEALDNMEALLNRQHDPDFPKPPRKFLVSVGPSKRSPVV